MAEEQEGERTEEPTETRREEFRKRGQVAQSKEVVSSAFLLLIAGLLFVLSSYFYSNFEEMFKKMWSDGFMQIRREQSLYPAFQVASLQLMKLIWPALFFSFVVGFFATVLQIGFLKVEDALVPKFEKINPVSGLKRIFSLKNLMEGVKSVLKIIFIGVVVYLVLATEIPKMPFWMEFSPDQIARYMGSIAIKLFLAIGLVMFVLAIGDFFFQRWDLEKKMMMTKQEIKEEMKNREIDPLIKGRLRRIQREMSQRRMMQKVPSADVVITNPTHIAVALKYDANLPAPQLIAKGADLVAQKIKEIAKEAGIPIIENKPLARTIYKTMKLGQVIPKELYVAVAEVLSYVYRLKKKKRKR
jgi:flagellar biosynthetic protein FlhB